MATAPKTGTTQHQSGRERLTDKRIEKLAAPAGKRIEIADTIVRELRIRVSDKGAKSWSVLYRVAGAGGNNTRGEQKRMTLRSEEHTSELQSLMRISYAVFCLKKHKQNN